MHSPDRALKSLSVWSVAHEQSHALYNGAGSHLKRTIPPCSKCSLRVHLRSNVLPSHTWILPSMLPVASSNNPPAMGPLNPTHSTESMCPGRVAITLPVSIWMTLATESSEPVTMIGASGWEQMEMMPPSWTCRRCCWGAPARGFQTTTPRSSEPVQMTLPPNPQQPHVTLWA